MDESRDPFKAINDVIEGFLDYPRVIPTLWTLGIPLMVGSIVYGGGKPSGVMFVVGSTMVTWAWMRPIIRRDDERIAAELARSNKRN